MPAFLTRARILIILYTHKIISWRLLGNESELVPIREGLSGLQMAYGGLWLGTGADLVEEALAACSASLKMFPELQLSRKRTTVTLQWLWFATGKPLPDADRSTTKTPTSRKTAVWGSKQDKKPFIFCSVIKTIRYQVYHNTSHWTCTGPLCPASPAALHLTSSSDLFSTRDSLLMGALTNLSKVLIKCCSALWIRIYFSHI